MTNDDLDALVARLKNTYSTMNQPHITSLTLASANAITALREERDKALQLAQLRLDNVTTPATRT